MMITDKLKILVVDDDQKILYAFREVMRKDGHTYLDATDGESAIGLVSAQSPDLVIMDINMPGMDGLSALEKIKAINPMLPVIIITGEGTMQTAIQAMRYGAFQYLIKPLSVTQIREEIATARLAVRTTRTENVGIDINSLKQRQLIGNSLQMHEVYKLIGSVCTTDNQTTVLITGETGTGKELVARAIHNNSAYHDEPFVAINCTAMPETLLESELFGHEKGAFTGAVIQKKGKFEVAGRGTIFLDEIGDLDPALQKKLLRVLQEREFERLGGHKSIPIEARFIAATNQEIEKNVKSGNFREDLYYRLNIVNIHMSALRERREDIPLLAHFFLARFNQRLKKSVTAISDEAMQMLNTYDFPGNTRELENIIERAVMLNRGTLIQPEHLAIRAENGQLPLAEVIPVISDDFSQARDYVLGLFEKEFLICQLSKYRGNISAAARASNMSRQNFYRLMEKHGLRNDPQ